MSFPFSSRKTRAFEYQPLRPTHLEAPFSRGSIQKDEDWMVEIDSPGHIGCLYENNIQWLWSSHQQIAFSTDSNLPVSFGTWNMIKNLLHSYRRSHIKRSREDIMIG